MSHHVLHVDREHRLPILVDLISAPGRTVVFTRTKRGAKTLGPPVQQQWRPGGRAARQPRPERAYPQPRGVPRRSGDGAGRHRHRRAGDPRRRRVTGRPRRPAGRAQGVLAPLRAHRPSGKRRHRRHHHDQRAGTATSACSPGGRHRTDDDPDPGRNAPGAGRAGPWRPRALRCARGRRAGRLGVTTGECDQTATTQPPPRQKRSGGSTSAPRSRPASGSSSTQTSGQKGTSRRTPRRSPGRPSSPGGHSAAAFSAGRR